MVAIDIVTNAAKVAQRLQQVQRSIPKITSRAMQLASEKARDDARASAKRRLDRPRPATLKAIKNRWPNRGAVLSGKANASVYIADFLVDVIHINIYGGIENRVPKSNKERRVIFPTDAIRLNKHGNIPGLGSKSGGKLAKFRRDRKNYLEVPLRNRSKFTRHLPAGMYQIKGKGRKRKLVMLIYYQQARIMDPKWRQYPKVVRKSFDKNYRKLFRKGLAREIGKQL